MARKKIIQEKPKNKWKTIIFVVLLLTVLSFIFSGFVSFFVSEPVEVGNIALIHVKGVIVADSAGGFGQDYASSTVIVKQIEKAAKHPMIEAVIFEINSPGGSAVASDEVAQAVKELNKTSVAWIREIGTSGAYWIASAADHIVANRMSITGSIGVFSSYLEFSGLLSDFNITYQRFVAGKFKDSGIPFRKPTGEERNLIQQKLDSIHEFFIDSVTNNRAMSRDRVAEMATGIIYIGSEAKDLGLIDELGGKKQAVNYIEEKLNITADIVEFKEKRSLLQVLGGVFNERFFYIGKGMGSSLVEEASQPSLVIRT